MTSSLAGEPPRKRNRPSSPSPSLFNTLPIEIIWSITSRVSKRSYPNLSCVCKTFRSILRSPEIHKIRFLLAKDSLYISFADETKRPSTRVWFTLRGIENNPTFTSVSIPFDYRSEPDPSVIAIGPEIFFICGSYVPSSSLWIFDTRSHKLRRGPNMRVCKTRKTIGLVGRRIYVIEKMAAESFDLKTQTWEKATSPEEYWIWSSYANVSLGYKVYAVIAFDEIALHYDTRDGSCGSFDLTKDKWWRTGVCGIDNVLYVYYARFGLMWYDFELRLWRVVFGFDVVKNVGSVAMAEYYGKLAFLWEESCGGDVSSETIKENWEEESSGDVVAGSSGTKEVWCRMIDLVRSEEGIHGTAGRSRLLGVVPSGYKLRHCLSVSD